MTDHAETDPGVGTLIVIVRPEGDDHHVLGGGGNGVLRAAVSVAVGSGNGRLWDDAPANDTIERPVRNLPEVVRAAADGAALHLAHVGCIRIADAVECVAMWFETEAGVAGVDDRRNTLRLLGAAAEIGASKRIEAAELAAAEVAANAAVDDEDAERTWDHDDPGLDPNTGLVTHATFTRALEDFEGEQAALVLIDLDHFTEVNETFGHDAADVVVRIAADRLLAACRGSDIVARLDGDRFGIIFRDVDRSIAMQISKRLLATLGEPLDVDGGPDTISATVSLAHQSGLVDMDELLELADGAIRSGKRSGRGRLVLAA